MLRCNSIRRYWNRCTMSKKTDISALYMSVKELNILLREHRINLVVDFIHETACDVLDDLGVLKRINEYDYNVCKKFSYAKWRATVKANTAHYLPILPHHLYAMFLVCRKMTIEDKIIVIENFEQTRIWKNVY